MVFPIAQKLTKRPSKILPDGSVNVKMANSLQLAEGLVVEVISKDIAVVHEGGGHWILSIPEFCAFGSGADIARGAMMNGASAEEAIRIASKIDIFTGGDVQTLELPKTPRKPKHGTKKAKLP